MSLFKCFETLKLIQRNSTRACKIKFPVDERIPYFLRLLVGTGASQQEQVWVLVPPVGTRFGDTMKRGFDSAILEFISPKGESRGLAKVYRFTPA